MISQSAEYSLRAVLCLAAQPRGALTTQQIAERARIPAGYLAKILQILARSGIVSSQRGLNGGFSLAVAPDALTLLTIVAAVEPSRRILECPIGHAEHALSLCPLHRRLDAAAASVERILRETTIADILAESVGQPLCRHEKDRCASVPREGGSTDATMCSPDSTSISATPSSCRATRTTPPARSSS